MAKARGNNLLLDAATIGLVGVAGYYGSRPPSTEGWAPPPTSGPRTFTAGWKATASSHTPCPTGQHWDEQYQAAMYDSPAGAVSLANGPG